MMPRPAQLSLAEAANLPAALGITTAARLLGIGRTTAYQLATTGRFPTPVLRIGHTYRVPAAPLLALLGITPQLSPTDAQPPAATQSTWTTEALQQLAKNLDETA